MTLDAPLAQSKSTRKGASCPTVEARWSRYCERYCLPSFTLPSSSCVLTGSAPSCRMRRSISSSSASFSLKPLSENILMPLCSNGLCDAEITTPASAWSITVRYATPGVGITPSVVTSQPQAVRPAMSAHSSISDEIRVSLPMTTIGFVPVLSASEIAADWPTR